MSDLPIACELGPDELRHRRESLFADLIRQSSRVTRLDSGLRFRLADDLAAVASALEVVRAERQCCRFLAFELRFRADLGAVELDVTGPPGTLEFLVETVGVEP